MADLPVPHSLVETSHRDVGIEVSGPAAEQALSAACALDLSAMPAGSVTRTIFDRAPIVLVKRGSDHYRIDVWQSFAPHVWGLLEAVSREIALSL
jgi:sarcosine oxidase subunit gamma